jgi:hypothetical protein
LQALVRVCSICYCPIDCIDNRRCDRGRSDFDRRLCNDEEAHAECDAANAEVTDMVNSLGRNADLLLSGLIVEGALKSELASFLRTKLSYALELDKPVGGQLYQ